jgi:hypothetical protein
VAGQDKEGAGAIAGELVAHPGRGERAQVEFDDGAAARREVVPQNPGPGCPVEARLGCHGNSAMARAEQEVRVDLPAAGLRRGEPRDPVRIGGGVPHHQLERSADDPAGVIDVVNGELESGQQVPAGLDPAGPGQGNESADLDG